MTYGTLAWHPERRRSVGDQVRRACWSIRALPHVMIRIKRVFPRIERHSSGRLILTDTPEVAYDVQWLCSRFPLDMDSATEAHLHDQVTAWTDRRHAIDDILSGHAAIDLGEPARTPRDYQAIAAAFARASGRVLIADDVGLGKTLESLLVLSAPDALPALVVTLTHLPQQWLRELAATWPALRGHAVTKSAPYDLTTARGSHGRSPDVLVMNYHKLDGWDDVLAGQVKTVIFDEAQELRHGTGTYKGAAAAKIAAAATYVVGLSATPVYNYGGEIHNVMSIIAPDSLGSRDEFIREWSGWQSNGKVSVADPAALGTYLRDAGLMLRRTRKDVHRELPDPLRIRQTVESDESALERVNADVRAMAQLVLDANAKSTERFTAAGDLDWRLRQATGIAKAPYVAEFVRLLLDSEDRVVVCGWHRAVYDIWADRLADFNPVLYTGTESPTQKQAAFDAFTQGDSRVMFLSLRAGAGLDGLQNASSVIVFGELDWSPGVHDQCIGRLARDGQESTVAAYFLVCEDGSDPVMDEVLQLKRMQAEPIRDPNAPLFASASSGGDRIKLLAQAVLDRQHQEVAS